MAELRKPNIKGTDHEMIAQMRSYLYQLVDELQYALSIEGKTAEPTTAPRKEAEAASRVNEVTKKKKELQAKGWYKLGTIRGDSCAVVTLTIGGDDQTSPCVVDIATEHNNARMVLRMQAQTLETIARIGLSKESERSYGLYAYYNTDDAHRVEYRAQTLLGTFTAETFAASDITGSNLLWVMPLKS